MRFEKLVWAFWTMWLIGAGSLWTAAPDVSGEETGTFQAADGCSEIPPPRCQ